MLKLIYVNSYNYLNNWLKSKIIHTDINKLIYN